MKYLRSCYKKIRYAHPQTAENAVRALCAKGDPNLVKYRCQFCNGWHVGHVKGEKTMNPEQRAPYMDKPCEGGNHFTLGYTTDEGIVFVCPNKGCRLEGQVVS